MNFPYWFELAATFGLMNLGVIFLGAFAQRTPRWARLLKLVVGGAAAVAISAAWGRSAFFVAVAAVLIAVVVVHAWLLPRRGIHGLTGEPLRR